MSNNKYIKENRVEYEYLDINESLLLAKIQNNCPLPHCIVCGIVKSSKTNFPRLLKLLLIAVSSNTFKTNK